MRVKKRYDLQWKLSGDVSESLSLYVIIDVSERKKNLWYNKNYHNITERGFICITARN